MTAQHNSLLNGRFLLQQMLGEGGMAQVWRAYDQRLQVWRAVKLLLPEYAKRKKLRKRFETEAQAMALLEHPNIVRVYDVGSDGNDTWIIMELCDGGSVEAWLNRHGPMPPRLAVSVVLQIAAGVAMAHDNGVVHRDIKPQNALISAKGVCKVTDFGIAQLEQANMTRTGTVMGTLGFMAPEQRSDSKKVDTRSDIYSVGATLYNLLTGHIHMDLFAAERDPEILQHIPQALKPLVSKATAYSRDERFPNVDELSDALHHARESLPPDPPNTAPLVDREIKRPPAPSLVEQALAEAKRAESGPRDATPLPGETILPKSFMRGTILPNSLQEASSTYPPEGDTDSDIDDEPTQPLERVKLKREKKKLGKLPWVPRQERKKAPKEEKKKLEKIPWVPHEERRAAPKEELVDFAALYEEKQSSRRGALDIGLKDGEQTWDQRREAEEAQEEEEEDYESAAEHGATLRGVEWALKEAWEFFTQILTGILQFTAAPFQYLVWPVVAVLAIATVASYRGASQVSTAERFAQSSWHQLSSALDDSEGVIDELSQVGGNRQVLDVHMEAYRQARTEEEKVVAALKLSAVVEEQYSRLGEADDPTIERRRKVLESRVRYLRRNKQTYLDSTDAWTEAASTTTGKLAVSLGLAGAPPPTED
jgi:serine/threonine protein kinase